MTDELTEAHSLIDRLEGLLPDDGPVPGTNDAIIAEAVQYLREHDGIIAYWSAMAQSALDEVARLNGKLVGSYADLAAANRAKLNHEMQEADLRGAKQLGAVLALILAGITIASLAGVW